MAIDFSKAFDTVPHDGLITSLSRTTLPNNVVRWLSSYLRGRQARCSYEGNVSPYCAVRAGVPQGSVISPVIFNFYVADYPHSAPLVTSYADDFSAAASAVSPAAAAALLSAHASDVARWANEKGLTVSIPKSHATLLTPDTHQSRLDPGVRWGADPLSHVRTPTILGVTFDPHLTFASHTAQVAERAGSRLKILRALAGTSWGQDKETLLTTYKFEDVLGGSPAHRNIHPASLP